jgi:formate hydrogenlyase transcriptional activator
MGNVLQVAMPELIGKAGSDTLYGRSPAESHDAERATILKALEEARGQIGGPDGAAARLGLKRTTLQSRMRKYNIARQFS